jgi:hypothetical protein
MDNNKTPPTYNTYQNYQQQQQQTNYQSFGYPTQPPVSYSIIHRCTNHRIQ